MKIEVGILFPALRIILKDVSQIFFFLKVRLSFLSFIRVLFRKQVLKVFFLIGG